MARLNRLGVLVDVSQLSDAAFEDVLQLSTAPAIATDPYWAAAPSRSTSTYRIAALGICERSAPCDTAATDPPLTCTSAERWTRLPLISTSVSSGDRRAASGG